MPFKFMFVFIPGYGHLQICLTIAKYLLYKDPKNEITFLTNQSNADKIKATCSQFKIKNVVFARSGPAKAEEIRKRKLASWSMKNKERYLATILDMNEGEFVDWWKREQDVIVNYIKEINPDLIFVENLFDLPFITALNYKFVMMVTTNPLKVADQISYPPMLSGMDVNEDYSYYTNVLKVDGKPFRDLLEKWYEDCGIKRRPAICHIQPSEYLNVFLYPKMLNYFEPEDLEGKWTQLSSTIVNEEVDEFLKKQGWMKESNEAGPEILTPEFMNKPGKLIYLSFGTIVSSNIEVFDKIMPVIAKNKNKFIISLGSKADEIALPDNCLGASSLNQLAFLKSGLIDLFVSHLGNNSFTEACYFGVPMVGIPFMGDQCDNARRLEALELGKRVLYCDFSQETFDSAIDYVIGNESIKNKMKEISKQMKVDDGLERLYKLVHEIVVQ